MKSRLIQLSRGNIEYRVPDVRFGVETLSGLLLQDRKAAFEVTVNSENNVPMHLFFFSQNPRIRVSQPLSIGRTGKFTVEINTVGLVPNDRILGDIDIVYNGGRQNSPMTLQSEFPTATGCRNVLIHSRNLRPLPRKTRRKRRRFLHGRIFGRCLSCRTSGCTGSITAISQQAATTTDCLNSFLQRE